MKDVLPNDKRLYKDMVLTLAKAIYVSAWSSQGAYKRDALPGECIDAAELFIDTQQEYINKDGEIND
jgi:hypothetical protein